MFNHPYIYPLRVIQLRQKTNQNKMNHLITSSQILRVLYTFILSNQQSILFNNNIDQFNRTVFLEYSHSHNNLKTRKINT